MNGTAIRTRWAAVGAAVAITLGAGGIGLVSATSPDGAVAYSPLGAPCRAGDTRPGTDNVGPKSTPIGADQTHIVNADDGECAGVIPSAATGVALNVTALNATAGSFLTIWAIGERPKASSLNPTPGQPPAPNAVNTAIDGSGDFKIYNRSGEVDVVIDIVGYYIDHDHDDRYYPRADVDALIAAGPSEIDIGVYEMQPEREDTSWGRNIFFSHTATGDAECLTMPIVVKAGQRFESFRISYFASEAVDVSGIITGVRSTPGSFDLVTELLDVAVSEVHNLPPTVGTNVESVTSVADDDAVALEGYRYAGLICTAGQIAVAGALVTLAD